LVRQLTATDNQLRTPQDFDSYCVAAPSIPTCRRRRLQVCGLSDVSVAKFTQVDNLVTQSSHYGKQQQVNNFIDVAISTHLRSGVQFGGGIDTAVR